MTANDRPLPPKPPGARIPADSFSPAGPVKGTWDTVIAGALVVVLGVAIPAILIMLSWNPHGLRILLVFPAVVALYCAVMLALESRRPIVNQLRTFFYTFAYVSFGTSTIPQLLNNRFPWKGTYTVNEIVVTYLYVLAGLAVFEAVFWLTRRHYLYRPEAVAIRISNVSVVISLGFVFISALLLYTSGWYQVMFQPRIEAGAEIYGQLGSESVVQLQLRSMHGLSLVGALVLLLAAWGDQSRGGPSRWLLRGVSLLVMGYTMVIGNPISTSRAWFATVLIAIAGAWIQMIWPSLRRQFAVITALGYLFVFPLVDVYRSQYDLAAFEQNQIYSVKENVTESFFNGDFDSFQQVMNARRAIEVEGYQLGRQMAGTILFWFPRSLWPDKPLNSGDWIAITVGYGYSNLSAPLWAEGIVDFGFLGTLTYIAAYALMIQWLYRRESAWNSRTPYYMTAVLITAPYSVYLLRGGLLSCVAYVTPAMLAVSILILVERFLGTRGPGSG